MNATKPNLLHELVVASARHHPDAPALRFQDRALSYAELDAQSNRVANTLLAQGCEPGDRVALLIQKGLDAYVGLYGILKAGCVYVPLDKRAPDNRLAYIVADCGVRAVVSTKETAGRVRKIDGTRGLPHVVVGGEADLVGELGAVGSDEISRFDPTTPENPRGEDDLAYILYTSGSTGAPKGVMISHRNAMTFVRWSAGVSELAPGDRVSGHAPLHFDLSIFDVYATALVGATLYPVPESTGMFPAAQLKWMAAQGINVWYSVPSALSMMAQLDSFADADLSALRVVVFAGEVFPPKFLRSWVGKLPDASFFNWYGPTETNVVTAHVVDVPAAEITEPLPIGKACDGIEVFLIDEHGQRVDAVGARGEVAVTGPCVAHGYWGDPDRSGKVFVETDSDGLMYRTGDLGEFDAHGVFTYHGRIDHQIKSRGYRIEIGEIESALATLPEVGEAVVIPVPDDVITNRLIAVVALKGGFTTPERHILEQLTKILPHYMVPESVEFREELPKTSTGKIDRQGLHRSDHTSEASASAIPLENS